MDKHKDLSPIEGVTIGNGLRYIHAVEDAAQREILDLPIEDRSFMLGVIKANLQLAVISIDKLQVQLEEKGDALPITDAQRLHFQLMLQLATKNDKS